MLQIINTWNHNDNSYLTRLLTVVDALGGKSEEQF